MLFVIFTLLQRCQLDILDIAKAILTFDINVTWVRQTCLWELELFQQAQTCIQNSICSVSKVIKIRYNEILICECIPSKHFGG